VVVEPTHPPTSQSQIHTNGKEQLSEQPSTPQPSTPTSKPPTPCSPPSPAAHRGRSFADIEAADELPTDADIIAIAEEHLPGFDVSRDWIEVAA
jgi:hypothetical protein